MRVLVATFTYFPNIDGVAEAAGSMVKAFSGNGHDVYVATCSTDRYPGDESRVSRFSICGSPVLFGGFRGETREYLDFIARLDPDVIVFHGWDTWPVEVAMGHLRTFRARSVLLSHGQSSHILNTGILPRGLWRWLRWLPRVWSLPFRIRRFDRVVFLSGKCDWGRFFDVSVARVTGARNVAIIPNGVPELPTGATGVFRERHSIGPGTMFLCIANYSLRKNQGRALQAFAQADLADATLVFIGSELGSYGHRMVTLWQELLVAGARGRVLFLEGLQRSETLEALRDCDVKVLAADAETQPIVLLEAMAASKPFISTSTGCVEELKGGIIVENDAEMAKAMRRLAEGREEREQLGIEGRIDYEKHYNVDRTTQAWLQLLNELS